MGRRGGGRGLKKGWGPKKLEGGLTIFFQGEFKEIGRESKQIWGFEISLPIVAYYIYD